MDYLYENLGENRFQEFCSTLIAKEFQDFQAFPIGQPDGGRDTIVYLMDAPKKDFIVFQVKFVRNPKVIPDIHKWLTSIIEKEAPKIEKLLPQGAKKYYLLTNVDGTAHLTSGSKDKVNQILEEKISIPSICWWRDDLSRLLEKDVMFKWSYPDIISGQDVLNSLLFKNLSENTEKRENIIKAYLADQYELDNEVKFRQIDLQNNLLDLFTDVPIKLKKINEKNKKLKKTLYAFRNYNRFIPPDEVYNPEDREEIGAAHFLLHPQVQHDVQRIHLEGGPGQGKSTISQYICQVHRIRLLQKNFDLRSLPKEIGTTPVRLPFKIDLRQVASWLEKKNPYLTSTSSEKFLSRWEPSLESFLVHHVIYHSKIDDLKSSDLIAILKLSPVLFVFDGFDEIANLKIREEVIDFINKGINRLHENAKSIQVLITSRPAAFSDTIGFSVDIYPHFELTDITPPIILEYVNKWIKASRLGETEANEIRRLVEEKLKLPHLKELAKSPMQLAIFISLLRTRGESLPNKRTALYDSYIELFFNRESEKSLTIRNNRDLIIDIHQYLAWVLHSEAELLKNSGIIGIEDLHLKLKSYLEIEGHRPDIAEELFHVMEERVCALVSRVQGTYEFEVQPLREYFCARFLYNTSPYSPTGREKTGTLPDRFDAISRNFYWHNVVRFFAGCFDKGQLPMLIYKLQELQDDKILKYTNYPRVLTSQILSDWVFTQYPKLMEPVVQIIVRGINIGSIMNQETGTSSNDIITLPNQSGRLELVEECFRQLKTFPHSDYALELIGLIRNNPINILDYWVTFANSLENKEFTNWLDYAYRLGIIYKLEDSQIQSFTEIDDEEQQIERLQTIISGNKLNALLQKPDIKKKTFKYLLDGNLTIISREKFNPGFQFISIFLHPYVLNQILEGEQQGISFKLFTTQIFHGHQIQTIQWEELEVKDNIDKKIKKFLIKVDPLLKKDLRDWKKSIESWNELFEEYRKEYGETNQVKIAAIITAGIKSRTETFEEYSDLNNSSLDLLKRVRCARMKSGNVNYWSHQLATFKDPAFGLTILFTWATSKTLIKLEKEIEKVISKIDSETYLKIFKDLKKTTKITKFKTGSQKEIIVFLKNSKLNNKVKLLLSHRFEEEQQYKHIFQDLESETIPEINVTEIKLENMIEEYIRNPDDTDLLKKIRTLYQNIKIFNSPRFLYHHYRYERFKIPLKIARQIMEQPISYPRSIASIAEKSCRLYANKEMKAVGKIAQDENWFRNSNTYM